MMFSFNAFFKEGYLKIDAAIPHNLLSRLQLLFDDEIKRSKELLPEIYSQPIHARPSFYRIEGNIPIFGIETLWEFIRLIYYNNFFHSGAI